MTKSQVFRTTFVIVGLLSLFGCDGRGGHWGCSGCHGCTGYNGCDGCSLNGGMHHLYNYPEAGYTTPPSHPVTNTENQWGSYDSTGFKPISGISGRDFLPQDSKDDRRDDHYQSK